MKRRFLSLVVTLVTLALVAPSYAAKRVALVVGIDDYENLPSLQKAVNDARSVAGALNSIGFEVLEGENLTRRSP